MRKNNRRQTYVGPLPGRIEPNNEISVRVDMQYCTGPNKQIFDNDFICTCGLRCFSLCFAHLPR